MPVESFQYSNGLPRLALRLCSVKSWKKVKPVGLIRVQNLEQFSAGKSIFRSYMTTFESSLMQNPSNCSYQVASFYRFMPYSANQIDDVINSTNKFLSQSGIKGTIVVAEEGYNGQIELPQDPLLTELILNGLQQSLLDPALEFNIGYSLFSKSPPFRKTLVKKRSKLTANPVPNVNSNSSASFDLSAMEWQSKLLNSNSRIILDVRNGYESSIGSFYSSTPLNTNTYAETWDRLDDLLKDQPLDKEIFAYCTGGIRCVKVARHLYSKGYRSIYTLKQGIIGYQNWIRESNHSINLFQGENYLFDRRRIG